jgi:hypothetical protein
MLNHFFCSLPPLLMLSPWLDAPWPDPPWLDAPWLDAASRNLSAAVLPLTSWARCPEEDNCCRVLAVPTMPQLASLPACCDVERLSDIPV